MQGPVLLAPPRPSSIVAAAVRSGVGTAPDRLLDGLAGADLERKGAAMRPRPSFPRAAGGLREVASLPSGPMPNGLRSGIGQVFFTGDGKLAAESTKCRPLRAYGKVHRTVEDVGTTAEPRNSTARGDVDGVTESARIPTSASSSAAHEEGEFPSVLDKIKWDRNGLVVAIAQHIDTGAVLMQGFANRDAILATLSLRRATFFSRSRSSLWTKGETSQNFINVVDMYLDCDRDSIIYLGSPDGPSCHTGAETCFYTPAFGLGSSPSQALTTLYSLEATIAQRKVEESPRPSWTKKLLENPQLLCSKIREEADELCRTVENDEGRERSVSEMADLLYHSMVLLSSQDAKMKEVLEVLRKRFSRSGIEEKKSRRGKS